MISRPLMGPVLRAPVMRHSPAWIGIAADTPSEAKRARPVWLAITVLRLIILNRQNAIFFPQSDSVLPHS